MISAHQVSHQLHAPKTLVEIRTLNINVKATIKPVAKDNERSPDYRVAANRAELGAGWRKAAKDTGAEYVSVKLDGPWSRAKRARTSSSGRADRPVVGRPARGAVTRPCSPARDILLVASQPSGREQEPSDRCSPRPEHPFSHRAHDAAGRLLSECSLPSDRHCHEQRVKARIIEAFADVAACCEDQAFIVT